MSSNTVSVEKAKRFDKLAAKQGVAQAHAGLAQLQAESGKDADIRKTQKHLNKARATLAAGSSEFSVEERRIVQCLYEQANLASLFRCRNEGCSVAYSEDVTVQSAKSSRARVVAKWRIARWSARLLTGRQGTRLSAAILPPPLQFSQPLLTCESMRAGLALLHNT